jgi:hypothetical protein
MPNKSQAQKDRKESPSKKHGDKNKSQGGGSGNKVDNWQQGQQDGSRNANANWQQGQQDGSRNANDNWQQGQQDGSRNANDNRQQAQQDSSRNMNDHWQPDQQGSARNMNDQWQVPGQNIDLGDQTKTGCLPVLFARIKNAFKRSASGGCLLQLSILLLPLMAVGAILLITL